MSTGPEPRGPTPASDHQVHTLRARGSVAIGLLAVVAAALLLAYARDTGLVFVSSLLLVVALGVVLFIRPCVRLSIEGMSVHNPFRHTFLPWRLVEDVTSRWNLEVHTEQLTVSAWAISGHVDRPKGTAPLGLGTGLGMPGPAGPATTSTAPESGIRPLTAQRAARQILDARAEWLAAVERGVVVEPEHPALARAWSRLDLALVLVPTLLLVVGLVRPG